jgi:hypothetical protein
MLKNDEDKRSPNCRTEGHIKVKMVNSIAYI